MTLGNAAAACVRLIVWCRACRRHQVEPDPARRYGPETTVPDWRKRLVCSRCGSHEILLAECEAVTRDLARLSVQAFPRLSRSPLKEPGTRCRNGVPKCSATYPGTGAGFVKLTNVKSITPHLGQGGGCRASIFASCSCTALMSGTTRSEYRKPKAQTPPLQKINTSIDHHLRLSHRP
jgi:hypothetical protein